MDTSNVRIGFPVVYRDHAGDYAALVTGVTPADPNIRDSEETVSLAVFRPGLIIAVHETGVRYSTSGYGCWRNLDDDWSDADTATATYEKDIAPEQVALPAGDDLAAFRQWQLTQGAETPAAAPVPVTTVEPSPDPGPTPGSLPDIGYQSWLDRQQAAKDAGTPDGGSV